MKLATKHNKMHSPHNSSKLHSDEHYPSGEVHPPTPRGGSQKDQSSVARQSSWALTRGGLDKVGH